MNKITLFAMTQKGHSLLADTVIKYRPLFGRVIIGRDAALDNDYSEEIKALCETFGIEWEYRSERSRITTEYALAVSWRWMINFPNNRLIVFHDSLLPRYRGFNPLVSAMINGDTTVGVTALFGAGEYDSGAIIAQSSTDLSYPCTIDAAINQIGTCYTETACAVLAKISAGEKLVGTPQDETKATYSLWRDDDDYWVDWSLPSEHIVRMINAVGHPYDGARTHINDGVAKIVRATALPDVRVENRSVGKVIRMDDGRPVVVCGSGVLRIDELIDAESESSLLPLTKFRSRFS